jgi:hypothetical protein
LVNPFPTSPFIPQQQPNTNTETRPTIIYKNKKPATANNSHPKKKRPAIVYKKKSSKSQQFTPCTFVGNNLTQNK